MPKITFRMGAVLASLIVTLLSVSSVVPFERIALAATVKETQDARKAIETSYRKSSAAQSRKDVHGSLANRTNDFVHIMNGRRQSGNKDKGRTAAMYKAAESIQSRTVIQKFTLKGNTAIVRVKGLVTLVFPATKNEKRRVHRITSTMVHTWVKRNGRWLVSQSEYLTTAMTVNGKPVKSW